MRQHPHTENWVRRKEIVLRSISCGVIFPKHLYTQKISTIFFESVLAPRNPEDSRGLVPEIASHNGLGDFWGDFAPPSAAKFPKEICASPASRNNEFHGKYEASGAITRSPLSL